MSIFEISVFWLTIAPSYYGLMYILWFIYGLYFLRKTWKYTKDQIDSLFLYIFLWTLVGWRIWYILFYNFSAYISQPLDVFKIWEWWMSFHWGFLWVVYALFIFSKLHKIKFWALADIIAMIIPVGLFFGRIWNYINNELLGFPYTGPLSVNIWWWSYFPSPLVEALLEGMCIFILFHCILKKPRFIWQFAALFVILYWLFRTFVELFIRIPDPQIGYYFGFFTQWSLLSIPMIIIGWILYYHLKRNKYA